MAAPVYVWEYSFTRVWIVAQVAEQVITLRLIRDGLPVSVDSALLIDLVWVRGELVQIQVVQHQSIQVANYMS